MTTTILMTTGFSRIVQQVYHLLPSPVMVSVPAWWGDWKRGIRKCGKKMQQCRCGDHGKPKYTCVFIMCASELYRMKSRHLCCHLCCWTISFLISSITVAALIAFIRVHCRRWICYFMSSRNATFSGSAFFVSSFSVAYFPVPHLVFQMRKENLENTTDGSRNGNGVELINFNNDLRAVGWGSTGGSMIARQVPLVDSKNIKITTKIIEKHRAKW